MVKKNLAVFFDGTWNEPNDRTNVYELYKAAPETSTQETLYIEGVGTQGQGLWAAIDKFMGGAFGAGLSANIRQGYRWLCQRHQPGDRIFLFGFSRGAYSARSLAGMVRKCGLLNEATEANVSEAYALYRDDCTPSSLEAAAFRHGAEQPRPERVPRHRHQRIPRAVLPHALDPPRGLAATPRKPARRATLVHRRAFRRGRRISGWKPADAAGVMATGKGAAGGVGGGDGAEDLDGLRTVRTA